MTLASERALVRVPRSSTRIGPCSRSRASAATPTSRAVAVSLACVVLGASSLLTSIAGGQTSDRKAVVPAGPAVAAEQLDPETRVLAREFAIRGAEAFEAGDFTAALDHFNRASAILDVPSIAVMQARTLVNLGRWIEGLDRFQQTARLALEPDAPLPYRTAVTQAAAEAEALRQQIPQLALSLPQSTIDAGPHFEIHLDDKVVPHALLNISRPVDPGKHEVRAASNGKVYFKRTLTVTPNQRVQISITPPPKATDGPSGPKLSSGASKPGRSTDPSRNTTLEPNWPFYGALGLTGLGLTGAITTAVLGTSRKATLDEVCNQATGECPPQYESEISALRTERTLFYVSTGLTLLAGSVATYLWLSDQDQSTNVALRLSPVSATLVARY